MFDQRAEMISSHRKWNCCFTIAASLLLPSFPLLCRFRTFPADVILSFVNWKAFFRKGLHGVSLSLVTLVLLECRQHWRFGVFFLLTGEGR